LWLDVADEDQTVRISIGKRAQQHRVDDAEHGGVSARVSAATAVNPGLFRSLLSPTRTSSQRVHTGYLLRWLDAPDA
jgi:hypothetical protein